MTYEEGLGAIFVLAIIVTIAMLRRLWKEQKELNKLVDHYNKIDKQFGAKGLFGDNTFADSDNGVVEIRRYRRKP